MWWETHTRTARGLQEELVFPKAGRQGSVMGRFVRGWGAQAGSTRTAPLVGVIEGK